jgi:hypothetical protein
MDDPEQEQGSHPAEEGESWWSTAGRYVKDGVEWGEKGVQYAVDDGVAAAKAVEESGAGKVIGKAASVASVGFAAKDFSEAMDNAGTQKGNNAMAEMTTDLMSAIPAVGAVVAGTEALGYGAEKAVGWDREKEGTSMVNYGVERTLESVGLLNHVPSASEQQSMADVKQASAERAQADQKPVQTPEEAGWAVPWSE